MRRRERTLFWRIFLPNALVLLIAAAFVVVSPAAIDSQPSARQMIAIGLAVVLIAGTNLVIIRRALDPLERLTAVMAKIDPLEPGQRVEVSGSAETEQLVAVFNAMLERLESERRESGRRLLAASEGERVRLARELHDGVGQSVTGLMLEIDHASRIAPPDVRERLAEAREAARELSGELGEIVRRLRPETLDDLGLASALTVLGDRFTDQTRVPVKRRLEPGIDGISSDGELALYRVAQESLTNIARHSGAGRVELELAPEPGAVLLRISDDGGGLDGSRPGNGIRGMRERAMLAGGSFSIGGGGLGGVEVRLRIPREEAAR